jgi:hypothetical protein
LIVFACTVAVSVAFSCSGGLLPLLSFYQPPIEAARAWLQRLFTQFDGTILQRPYSIDGRKYLDFEWDNAAVIDRHYG